MTAPAARAVTAAAWDCGASTAPRPTAISASTSPATRSSSWGLFGGREGGRADFIHGPGVTPFDHGSGVLKAGQWVEMITPGAGGYGDPAARDRAAVARDLAEGVIDAETDRTVYSFAV